MTYSSFAKILRVPYLCCYATTGNSPDRRTPKVEISYHILLPTCTSYMSFAPLTLATMVAQTCTLGVLRSSFEALRTFCLVLQDQVLQLYMSYYRRTLEYLYQITSFPDLVESSAAHYLAINFKRTLGKDNMPYRLCLKPQPINAHMQKTSPLCHIVFLTVTGTSISYVVV